MGVHSATTQNSTGTNGTKEANSKEDAISVKSGISAIFQSSEPIVKVGKDFEAQGSDPHGTKSSHKTGYLETFMHHFKGNIGTGIFALGDAFKNSGLMLGIPLTIVLISICVYAQHILIKCNQEVMRRLGKSADDRQPDYATTIELSFATGPLAFRKYAVFMRKLVNFFLCVTQTGFCCVYIVFITNNIQQVLSVWGIDLEGHILMAIALVPILFSTWIRNLKYLVPLSSLANLLMLFSIFATIYMICIDLPHVSERPYVADWTRWSLSFGTIIYSFESIALVLPLRNEMKKPKNFNRPLGVLNVGMIIVGSLNVIMGFLSYLKYGEDILGSVTLNLEPMEEVLPQMIKLAISLSNLSTYTLQFYVPVVIIWPVLQKKYGPFSRPVTAEIIFRTALCLLTFVLAESIPKLGLFISLVGAMSSSSLALLFPPIAEIVLCSDNLSAHKLTVARNILILIIGFLGCFFGTYQSIKQIITVFFSAENVDS